MLILPTFLWLLLATIPSPTEEGVALYPLTLVVEGGWVTVGMVTLSVGGLETLWPLLVDKEGGQEFVKTVQSAVLV